MVEEKTQATKQQHGLSGKKVAGEYLLVLNGRKDTFTIPVNPSGSNGMREFSLYATRGEQCRSDPTTEFLIIQKRCDEPCSNQQSTDSRCTTILNNNLVNDTHITTNARKHSTLQEAVDDNYQSKKDYELLNEIRICNQP